MCGGFTCSKNALIGLNIIYIVSLQKLIDYCLSHAKKKLKEDFFVLLNLQGFTDKEVKNCFITVAQ
jgi:hypothetical protein